MNYKNNMNRIIMIYFSKLCYYKKTYETTLNKNFIMFLLTTSYCNLKKFCKGPVKLYYILYKQIVPMYTRRSD